MPADNSIYETLEDWWDPTGSAAGLHAMNPPRVAYFLDVLKKRLDAKPRSRPLLDVGCGGGLLTEELLKEGLAVIGVDRAEKALECARDHARSGGLVPRYVRACGERLPFLDESFAAVVSSDFLEHVDDLDCIVRECVRVLMPGGVFLYDTINRTWLSRLFHVGIVQEWRKLVPPGTHDWRQFIRPSELESTMRAAGLEPAEIRGLFPVHPVRFAVRLLFHRRGKEAMPAFRVGSWTAGSYLGYAVKPSRGPSRDAHVRISG